MVRLNLTVGTGAPPPDIQPLVIPPLESGDHLISTEFERRFGAMPDLKKAELVEGVVYMASPVRLDQHGEPHTLVMFWLGAYWMHTPFVRIGDNISVRLDGDNTPQPDASMLLDPTKGGQAQLSADGYVEGAPELIVEIAASTVSLDLNTKFRVYRRSNVREYVVWRVLDGVIDWFTLENGEYRQLPIGEDGLIRSQVFPGLWLDPTALLTLNVVRVFQVVSLGTADPSHAAFVAKLQA